MNRKRGVFFSTDALIALIIVFLVIVVAFPFVQQNVNRTELHYDILESLSALSIGQAANVPSNLVTDPNQTVLEQIGEFYVTNLSAARQLTNLMLTDLKTNENIGVWYGNTLVASLNATPYETAENAQVARQIISGLQEGESVTGFSARAFLQSGKQTKYFYFGGYVGDGNISAQIDYEGTISSAEMEIAINNDFQLLVNNNSLGTFSASSDEFTPTNITVPITHFASGTNTIELKGDNLHIAGGFLKITYDTEVEYQQATRYNFPGIEGLINLYDGFYIEGELTSVNISIHFNSTNLPAFLNIGNVTVFNSTSNDEETITVSNAELSSLLDYDKIVNQTVPLRLGLENISLIENITSEADVISVTDLSGSMSARCNGANQECCLLNSGDLCGSPSSCLACSGTWTDKISEAKQANKDFIDEVLASQDNQVGLIGYKDNVYSVDSHSLSNNITSLKNKVDEWDANGIGTCICCGINRAATTLNLAANPNRSQSMVVMSDGDANVECAQQGVTPDLNLNNISDDAGDDAIQAACDAFANNITVYAVGFGEDADETTMQQIAACGGGAYYYSDINELSEIYQEIAQTIIASYTEQTIEIMGEINTRIFPDSFIEFTYLQPPPPFGLILTTEEFFTNTTTGTFSVPENSSIAETRIISYSGPRWTDVVSTASNIIYNLSSYGSDFISLGDPYTVNIPNSLIEQNNTITLTTGVSPMNTSEGSSSNKIIYTIAKNVTSFSPVSAAANGCIWTIQFEDDTNLTTSVPSTATESCSYTSSSSTPPDQNVDAFQTAVYNLLTQLDLNSNGKVDISFTEQELQIALTELTGIPYTWSTEVQVRIWD